MDIKPIEVKEVIDSMPNKLGENTYPIKFYYRLYCAISGIHLHPSIQDLENIVKIVKEDFFTDNKKDY